MITHMEINTGWNIDEIYLEYILHTYYIYINFAGNFCSSHISIVHVTI